MKKLETERAQVDEKVAELTVTKDEMKGLADYYKRQSLAVKDDVNFLRDALKEVNSASSSSVQSSGLGDRSVRETEAAMEDVVRQLREEKERLLRLQMEIESGSL
jgi:hypothetical protein